MSRPCVQYPLNSKRLAAWHLRALAQALELPTTGSAGQLRQCIEAVVGTDHEYQNAVVTVRESPKTEYSIALADADGEFLASEPVYSDTRRVRFDEELQNQAELYATRRKLEEANHLLELAAVSERKQAEVVAELQQDCEEQATETCDGLRQQLAMEKEKTRRTWRASCDHLAQQDTVIMAQDEKVAFLKRWVTELEAILPVTHGITRPSSATPKPRATSETPGIVTTDVTHHSHSVAGVPLTTTTPVVESHSLQESGQPRDAPSTAVLGDATPSQAELDTVAENTVNLESSTETNSQQRRGRAPPIEFFTGEDPAIIVDDWLPSLERASTWNGPYQRN